MTNLVLGVPWNKKDRMGNPIGRSWQSHSWETFYEKGIAYGYALTQNQVNTLRQEPSKVVLLRNNKGHLKRAEAHLTNLKATGRPTDGGVMRYDVYFGGKKEVDYTYSPKERLAWNGVRIIPNNDC